MNDNGRATVRTNSTTWGQIKSDSPEIRAMVKNDMKVVIKQTKAVIESEDTILPDEDVTIYLFPGKVKSGVTQERKRSLAEEIINGFCAAVKRDLEETGKKIEEYEKARQSQPTTSNTYAYRSSTYNAPF